MKNKRAFVILNLAMALILFVSTIALTSSNPAEAQPNATNRASRQTDTAATINAVRTNTAATVEAARTNTAGTIEAVRTNIEGTVSAAQTQISLTATYYATVIQESRESFQATASAVYAELQEDIADQIDLLLESLAEEGIEINYDENYLYITLERTEAQTTEVLNAILSETIYNEAYASVDYSAPDTSTVYIQNVLTEGGRYVDYKLVYALVYLPDTDSYGIELVEIEISGISVAIEEVNDPIINTITAGMENTITEITPSTYSIDLSESTETFYLNYGIENAYITDASYVVEFIVELETEE